MYRSLTFICNAFIHTFSKEIIPVAKYFGCINGMINFVMAVSLQDLLDPMAVLLNLIFALDIVYLWSVVIVAANMTGLWLKSCVYIWNFKQLKSRPRSLEAKETARITRSFIDRKSVV